MSWPNSVGMVPFNCAFWRFLLEPISSKLIKRREEEREKKRANKYCNWERDPNSVGIVPFIWFLP